MRKVENTSDVARLWDKAEIIYSLATKIKANPLKLYNTFFEIGCFVIENTVKELEIEVKNKIENLYPGVLDKFSKSDLDAFVNIIKYIIERK